MKTLKARIAKAESLPKEQLDKFRLEYDCLVAELKELEGEEVKADDLTLLYVCITLGIGSNIKVDKKVEEAIFKGLRVAFIDKKLTLGLGMIRAGINEMSRRKSNARINGGTEKSH